MWSNFMGSFELNEVFCLIIVSYIMFLCVPMCTQLVLDPVSGPRKTVDIFFIPKKSLLLQSVYSSVVL